MLHILYLDDEQVLLDYGKKYLEKNQEFVVDTAISVDEALSLLSHTLYDGIVSDYQMPKMNGIEFLKIVRETYKNIPFIFFTGKGNQDVVMEAINQGADFFLEKDREPLSRFFEISLLLKQGAARYRAEQLLKKNEEIFRTIADYTADWEYWIDPEGTFIYISPSCELISGYTSEDFSKNPDLLSIIVAPSHRDMWSIHKYQQEPGNYAHSLEIQIIHKDGSIRWINHDCKPIFDENNIFQGRRVSNRDITAQKLIQDSMLQLGRANQIILDNVPAMIWYKDTKNNFLQVNENGAKFFGEPVARIEGKNASELFPDYADTYYKDDLEVIHSKKPKFGIIEQMTHETGEKRWVQTDKIPLFDEHGEVSGLLVFVVDITDRKKIDEALKLSNKKLRLLSDITRHDILNQIQALIFYTDSIEQSILDSTVQQNTEKISLAVRNIERQITFTRDYQDIGVQSPLWQNVKMTIMGSIRPVRLEPIQIIFDIPEIMVFADPLLEKVFYNLADNAKRYGEKISQILFSTQETPDGLIISIEDDGVGIPTHLKKAIFNREYYHNTGFGLNLTREILGITGLTIKEVGEPGMGARFEIMVPKESYRMK